MKKLLKNKKGIIWMYVIFMISAIIIVTVAGVLAPMGVLFNTKMMEAGVNILSIANESIQDIDDAGVRAAIGNATEQALDAGVSNIEVQSDLFQYSWVIVLILGAIIFFLATRRSIEVSGGGGGFI